MRTLEESEPIEITRDFHPDCHMVYVIEDKVLGYFAGFKPFAPPCTPMWCATLGGAKLYDSMRDITARVTALDIRDYIKHDARVLGFRRHYFYPEEYK